MHAPDRPQVVVSKCLGFAACRYNGQVIPDPFVEQLRPFVDFLPVCPEVEIGLGVPRPPIRVILRSGERRLVQPETGRDVTEAMERFAASFLAGLPAVDGFILKNRSPSCGIKDVKLYADAAGEAPVGKGPGFFGQAVLERFGHLAVEDEGRLTNLALRDHFLTKLFTLARFRRTKATGTMDELVRFHTEHKLLLMAYNQSRLQAMGRVVANPARRPAAEALADYEHLLWEALARPPRRTAGINVLMHAMGYFSARLTPAEKALFLDTLERYRTRRVPLSTPVYILRAWIARFQEPYLARQVFFEPYPIALVSPVDSGKDREVE